MRAAPDRTREPKLLCPKFHRDEADTGDIATRPVEAGDEAILDRVAPNHKDDRHRLGCGLGRERRRGIADDQGYLPVQQIGDQRRQSIKLIVGPAVFDPVVLTLDKPAFLEALAKCRHEVP